MGVVSMIPDLANAKNLMEVITKSIEKEFRKKGIDAKVFGEGTYLYIELGENEIKKMVAPHIPFQFFEIEGKIRIKVKVT